MYRKQVVLNVNSVNMMHVKLVVSI